MTNTYIKNFNQFVSTHQIRIGWHKAGKEEKKKIIISRTRKDKAYCDPLKPILDDLYPFIIQAIKEEGKQQKLSPKAIYDKIGSELVKTIKDGIKTQGKFTFRGNSVNYSFPKLQPDTIKKKKKSGAPYITQRLLQWGDLMNSVDYSIE